MFPKGRKLTVVLALLMGLLLLSGPAARAGGGGLPKQPAGVAQKVPTAVFSWAWRWMRSLWEKNGACIDPDGRCITSSQPDAGPHIDPDGRTLSQPDAGPHIDPNG
jgi:hypothetical protein